MDLKVRARRDPAVGVTMSRLEAREKATGQAVYTDDMLLQGMLQGAILTSPHPHADIVSYDTSRAEALKGVRAVITGDSFPTRYMGLVVKDETVLAKGKVRYIGEPVAAIAADSLEIARAALSLIHIEYRILPAVFTIDEALAPNAPVLHEDFASYSKIYDTSTCTHPNELTNTLITVGNIDEGFAQCDVIVDKWYQMEAQYHAYLEPATALASVDGMGKVTVWSSTQSVFRTQLNLHECLGIPMSKIRSVVPRIGGGFGGKSEPMTQPIAVALAMKARRPVKVTLNRTEDMTTMRTRHPARIRMRTGAKRDGTLVAREVEAWFDGGAYADDTPAVMNFALFFSAGPYRFRDIRVEGHGIYTNKMRAGAFRGFGNPQATFASETNIDEVALELGMDPLELRRRNLIGPGDRWLGGQVIQTSGLEECFEKVVAESRWHERRTPWEDAEGHRHGLGLALTSHVCGFLSTGAIIRLTEDGSLTLNTGAVDLGQGSDTALSQMCAGEFGVDVRQVNFVPPDTDAAPYNSGTNCSRVTYMVGRAIGEAAQMVRERMFRIAAILLECTSEEVLLLEGGLIGAKNTNRTVSFKDIAGYALWMPGSGGPITGTGSVMHTEPLDPKHTMTRGMVDFDNVGAFIFGAQVAEVAVDPTTGKVEVVEAWCAHDVGRAINPGAVVGQIEGGFVQGLGYALTEEMVWRDGSVVNTNFMDYKIPCALDTTADIHCYIVEVPDPTHPHGAKGIGEPPLIGAAAVIPNAVGHATGLRMRHIPITPERMFMAYNEADGHVQ